MVLERLSESRFDLIWLCFISFGSYFLSITFFYYTSVFQSSNVLILDLTPVACFSVALA